MQSSRRGSSLRRNSLLLGFALPLAIARPCSGQPAEDAEPLEPVQRPPEVDYELDPTKAFGERVILLVRTLGDDGVIMRLRAELLESEWRILEVSPDERFEPPSLAATAERERASAAVRIDVRRGTIELWVLRPEGPVEESIATPGAQRDEQVLALRASEILRARGILLTRPRNEVAPLPSESEPVRPLAPTDAPAPSPSVRERPAWLWLELGPALAMSPGGLGPLPLVEFGVRSEIAAELSLGLEAFVPLARQIVSAPEGEAELATWLGAGTLELDWGRSAFGGFRSGVGAGISVTTMEGTARDEFRGTSDVVTAFALLARSSYQVSLRRWFRLRLEAAVGATMPHVRVAFASREVASWGRPFVVVGVALEASPTAW